MQKVMCDSVIVSAPDPFGQPMSCSSATNISSSDRPVITSGITIGAVVIPDNKVRPRKGPNRASATPASVPRMTAPVAETSAIRIDSQAAPTICPFDNNSPYHLSVGEWAASQTVTSLELLNENTIIDRMGTYRKTSPNTSAVREKTPREVIPAPPARAAGNVGTS